MKGTTRKIYPFSNRPAKTDVQKGYRDYQSLFLVGRNPCDGSRVVSNILRVPSRTILSRGTELVVESFLVIDTRRIRFQFICYHEWWSSPLFDVWVPYSIYQSPSLSIAVYSSGQSPTPTVCFDFLEQCRSASGALARAMQRSQAGTALSLSSLFSFSQALISQRPSSTSSYRVRHHSFASPERYIVAIVTWSSKERGTNSLKALLHVLKVFDP